MPRLMVLVAAGIVLAAASAWVASVYGGGASFHGCLRGVVLCRSLLDSDMTFSPAPMRVRYHPDDEAYAMWVIESGGVNMTADGERLSRSLILERLPSGEGDVSDPIHADIVKSLWIAERYIQVSAGARVVYLEALGARSPREREVVPDVVHECLEVECNRWLRSMATPWVSWRAVERHADALAELMEFVPDWPRRDYVNNVIARVRRTVRLEGLLRAEPLSRDSRVVEALLTICESSDGRFVRGRVFSPCPGVPHAALVLEALEPYEMLRVLDYWDETSLTRLVEDGDVWTVVTMGEFIQRFAFGKMGRVCTREEFRNSINSK